MIQEMKAYLGATRSQTGEKKNDEKNNLFIFQNYF
jgi:hypothetical protein